MPRIKYTRNPKTANGLLEYNMKLKTFERHVQKSILKLQQDAQAEIQSFETFVDITISHLPPEIRQMTLGEILALETGKFLLPNETTCCLP